MTIDLTRARAFMTAHARLLDRRRFEILATGSDAARAGAIAAVAGYRNADGGFGWGLEPDLRAPESQPGAALHALEAIADAGPLTSPHSAALLDWLRSASLADGSLPFALPMHDPTACAPFWVDSDPAEPDLQITTVVAAHAHRAARWDAAVRDHPWLASATAYCLDAIGGIDEAPSPYVLAFSLQFLDAVSDSRPGEADRLIGRLGRFVRPDGAIPVASGEMLYLLDYAPEPGRPVRALVDDDAVAADLDRVEAGQRADGGWEVDFANYSEAAALEWRGYMTVRAVAVLGLNGRLPAPAAT